MKRILFYLILTGSIAASSLFILMDGKNFGNGFIMLKDLFIKPIIDGNFSFKFTPLHIYLYGLALTMIMNAALLITMLLIFLFSGFNLNKIAKFYRICTTFIVSSLIFTGVLVWFTTWGFKFKLDVVIKDYKWWMYLPLGSAIVCAILAFVFRGIERKNRY